MSDGNIQAAKTRLNHAVDRLTQPKYGTFNHTQYSAPCLYQQLQSEAAGNQGTARTPAKSLPPLWIDAVQLRDDIDRQVHKWCRRSHDVSTPARLAVLADNGWRPQDTLYVSDMARTIDIWCDSITNLLEPQSQKFISAPCPACGRETVYRKDSAGDIVRQPALKMELNVGCQCQHCKAHWGPDLYMHLARVLGFDLPEGVLE